MIRVAITGNIGSGKSYIASVLTTMGYPVYHADKEASKFLENPEVIMRITDRFGIGILTPDGLPDKRKLAGIVFNEPVSLQWLNHTLHPLVMKDWNRWLTEQTGAELCFMESAIIFEHNLQSRFDAVILVDAPEELMVKRVADRDQTTREQVEGRLKSQWPAEKKRALTQFIIRNDNQQMLLPQIAAVINLLKKV